MERHWGRVPKSKPRANSRCQIRITSTPLMDRSRGTANSCSTRFLSTSRRSIRASMALLGTSLVDGRLRPYCRSGVACHWISEEHTSELQSRRDFVCRHLLEKKKYLLSLASSQSNVFPESNNRTSSSTK